MSRPEPLRRKTSRHATAGRRILLLTTCVVAVAALSVSLWKEAANPRFTVQIVEVSGLSHTAESDVLAAAALPANQNAWLINRRALATRIQALPWVAHAAVRLRWPNRLSIEIVERQPAALVALGQPRGESGESSSYAMIDATQHVLELETQDQRQSDLPVLVVVPPPDEVAPGTTLNRSEVGQALDAYRRLVSLGLRISEVAIAPSTGISATADRNLRVLFGEDEDLAKKAELFQAIVAKISTPSRVAYVDVRSIRAPTVLYR